MRPGQTFALAVLAVLLGAGPAHAAEPQPSFNYLTTGNGHGFQVFDVTANAITQFLERPYRYLRPHPVYPDGEGVIRRNLAFDTYFGLRAGSQSAWLAKLPASEVGYVDQTNVIRSVAKLGSLTAESFYFAPFGHEGNAMVMILKVTNGGSSPTAATAFSVHNFKLGSASNPDQPGDGGESVVYADGVARETGPGGGAMLYLPLGGADSSSCTPGGWEAVASGGALPGGATCSGNDLSNLFARSLGDIPAGESRSWGVVLLYSDADSAAARASWESFAAGRSAEQLLTDALAEWEAWRAPVPALSGDQRRVWRQSEAVLRMGQIREPNTPSRKGHGMVLASLPPGGWHTGWVRDAVYGLVALARMGHHAEARAGLDFFLAADAGKYRSFLGGVDYRISTVRYFGNGEEEADYSGAPTRNIEIDGWGLVLWGARAYVDFSADVDWLESTTGKGDTVYAALREGVAEPLIANLEPEGMAIADASIWEVHWGNREHFFYTTAAAARGLCDMASLAARLGKTDDRDRYKTYAEAAVAALRASFVDGQGVLAGSMEKLARGSNYRDGAVVEAFTWGLIPVSDAIGTATLAAMSFLKTPVGGYKRIEGSSDQYDSDEWILIDLRAAEAFERAGQGAQAQALVDFVTASARVNFDLVPELYNTNAASGQIGRYTGSIPMVGYGAGAYVLTALARSGYFEYTDCGTEKPPEPGDGGPSYPDGGFSEEADGGNAAGLDSYSGTACVCRAGVGGRASWPAGAAVLVLATALLLRRRLIAVVLLIASSGTASAAEPEPAAGDIAAPTAAEPQITATTTPPQPTTGELRFELHGYARMPLALQGTPREPYLVDGDYYLSGFAYTRLVEPDWAELFFSAFYEDYEVKFGLFASLFSDYAETELENQAGIAHASLTAREFLGVARLQVEAGVFWDRFGYLPAYDTYLFGRTHQGGFRLRYDFASRAYVQAGAGVHQAVRVQNQGMTPVAHLVGGVPIGESIVSAYFLASWTRDKPKLSTIEDGELLVMGVDARVPAGDLGQLYAGVAHYRATRVLYLAPALELLHSTGGRGLAENFLGLESSDSGTGTLWVGAFDAPLRYRDFLARGFAMITHVRSEQATPMPSTNRDDRVYLKWGVEPGYVVNDRLIVGLRYDRVILSWADDDNGFRALSPRLRFPFRGWGELSMQYSRYFYGDKIQLRPGQVPLETEPDEHAFKLQAEATW